MIALDRELLASVVGGQTTGAETTGTEEQPGPVRREAEGKVRVTGPGFDTGWGSGKHETAMTGYTRCLELMPEDWTAKQIKDACGTPNNPKF